MTGRSIGSKLGALGESLLWGLGYHCSQGIVLVALVGLLVWAGYGSSWPGLAAAMQLLLDLGLDHSFLLVGATSLGALFLVVPAVRLRLGRHARTILGTALPRRDHALFSLAMIVPIAVIGDAVYGVAREWWSAVSGALPDWANWPGLGPEALRATFAGVPYPILVVAVALGPAVGEELVFRGVIGRRLISHWGTPAGIAITSLLFGAAHVSPAHAVATIPIAVLLHVLYLRCGTIWVPILIHFGNNLLAVSMVRFEFIPEWTASPLLVVWACAYLAILAVLLKLNERLLQRRAELSAT